MTTQLNRLRKLFEAILDEARRNKSFSDQLERAFGETERPAPRRSNRRAKALLDPFALFGTGEQELWTALGKLNVEQLKDVVAEYGMDRSKLALKWKSWQRLADLIVETVNSRARKGDVFRTDRGVPAAGSGAATAGGDSVSTGSGPDRDAQ